jgi:hypothetical protein
MDLPLRKHHLLAKRRMIMQKLINVVALLSGLVSLSVVGGGAYLYLNKDVLIERARKNATEAVTKAVTEALPGMVDAAVPELPKATGPALPSLP